MASDDDTPQSGDFDDADQLPAVDAGDDAYVQVVASLLRAEIGGARQGAFLDAFRSAGDEEKERLRLASPSAFMAITEWVEEVRDRVDAAIRIAATITPPDVAVAENAAVEARIAAVTAWDRYPYPLIIVPGYTPIDQRTPLPGVHPVARARLEEAVRAYAEGLAPFLLVSGGNAHPPGTPYFEGVEMKRALVGMGVAEDVVVVEARARHSTTNLRNAGRFMIGHGMARALVVAPGGGLGPFDQAFYFAHAALSTFHVRCQRELGYRVGDLQGVGPGRVAFTPAREVLRPSYRDPLDP